MMLNGKSIIGELLVILFVFTLSLFPAEARTTSVDGQKVLVISSYSPIKEEGNHLIASFIDQMRVDSEAKIFVEYMDCEVSPVFDAWVGWMRQLLAAYKVKPDVVVLLGNEAWSSYRATCVDSWYEIPVVLGYVKGAFIDYENKDKKLFAVADMMPMKESFGDFRITGYSHKDFVIENLLLIKRLQPHIRKVAFCYDNRYNMALFESYIYDLFKQIDSLDLRYMDGCKLSTPQLLDSVVCMDDSYAIGLKSEKTGEVEQIIGTERNITSEMKRRQELEENKLQLDFTLEAARIISWECNPDTRIFYFPRSTVFEGMTISLDEYLSFVYPEDRDLFRKDLEDLACGKIHVMEVQIRTMVPALGGDRWFEMHAVPYGRNEDGKIRKLIGLQSGK